jgi:hypothetical protein
MSAYASPGTLLACYLKWVLKGYRATTRFNPFSKIIRRGYPGANIARKRPGNPHFLQRQ